MSELNLELNQVSKRFGGLQAVDHVSFTVTEPQLIGMIGPNGAGKTTVTNLMSGMLKPSSGTIYLNGKRIEWSPALSRDTRGLGPHIPNHARARPHDRHGEHDGARLGS